MVFTEAHTVLRVRGLDPAEETKLPSANPSPYSGVMARWSPLSFGIFPVSARAGELQDPQRSCSPSNRYSVVLYKLDAQLMHAGRFLTHGPERRCTEDRLRAVCDPAEVIVDRLEMLRNTYPTCFSPRARNLSFAAAERGH